MFCLFSSDDGIFPIAWFLAELDLQILDLMTSCASKSETVRPLRRKLNDATSSHVDAIHSAGWSGLTEAGKIRPQLTDWDTGPLWDKRFKGQPKIPTSKEVYNVLPIAFTGLMGPKGLPKPIVQKIHDVFKKALGDPTVKAYMENNAMYIAYQSTEEYEKFVKQESERFEKIIQRLGLQKK